MNITLRSDVSSQTQSAENSNFRASIIIVSYNAKQKLMACLESVLRSLPGDCELIVVDNASVEGNADQIESSFPEVALIRSRTNLGFAGGCNLGVRHAQSPYLVFLNPDTLIESGWLESLIAPLESDERIGLVTPRILLMATPDRLNTCGCNIHISGLTLCRGMGRPRDSYTQIDEVGAISGAAFAIRRALFDKLGGFDEEMFLYLEDTDLSWRARLAGYPTVYTPESIVLHDYELRITPLKVFWEERNRYLMLLKSFKWRTIFVLLPAFILAETITWSFVLLKDRHNIRNKVRAYAWIIGNWATVMRKRKATQELRAVPDRTLIKSTGFKIDFDQAAGGLVAAGARFVFNPLFFVLRQIALALVWW
ncbi:MAG TPA: glycosyltransferase family 2 protein [Blastocatellia bacterium]|nr:glycosyltransferase family 2 protein [Blastocatellia bacterium]